MSKQKVPAGLNENVYDKIKKPFQSLLIFAKGHPLISLSYFLIFAVGVFLRLLVWWNYGTIQSDEGAHSVGGVFISKLLINGLRDSAGFTGAFIADYPGTLGGLWFYPPGYGLLTSVAFLLLGFSDFVARVPDLIFSVLLIHATIRVAKEIEPSEKVALVSAFLTATSSIVVIVGTGAMVDIPQATLTVYSILFWIRGMKNREGNAFLKAGLLGGLAGLMKPGGISILLFMIAFQVLMFLTSKDDLIFSKRFWKGIMCGFLIFSAWWVSAIVVKFMVGGWIGETAFNGVTYWFDVFGVFGRYAPPWAGQPWYAPAPWYTYEGWTYYANHLSSMMGILPFVFFFVGVSQRIKKMKRSDSLLILFFVSYYILQTFSSNKNPRYIIPCLPILFIYSSIGLANTYTNIKERVSLRVWAKNMIAISLVIIFGLGGLMPLLSAIKTNYTPGMGFGSSMPIQESLQIIRDDGNEGIIMPDSEDNYFNALTLTFYIASVDNDRKYGCHSPPSNVEDLLSFKIGDKGVRYILVHDLTSNVSRFVQSNPESFVLIGENSYDYVVNNYNYVGSIFTYRVIEE